jgi:hypothetical protein
MPTIISYLKWDKLMAFSHLSKPIQEMAEARTWEYYNLDGDRRNPHHTDQKWRTYREDRPTKKGDNMQLILMVEHALDVGCCGILGRLQCNCNRLWASLWLDE